MGSLRRRLERLEAEQRERQEARDRETARTAFLAAGGTEAGFPKAWEEIKYECALDAMRKADSAAEEAQARRMRDLL